MVASSTTHKQIDNPGVFPTGTLSIACSDPCCYHEALGVSTPTARGHQGRRHAQDAGRSPHGRPASKTLGPSSPLATLGRSTAARPRGPHGPHVHTADALSAGTRGLGGAGYVSFRGAGERLSAVALARGGTLLAEMRD